MVRHELERFAKTHHFEWEFRNEAFVYLDTWPSRPNLIPIASTMRAWLLRTGNLSALAEDDKVQVQAITNPYSYHASVIAAILARNINDGHAFATSSPNDDDGIDAEVRRIRLYSEQVLQTTRFCEAAIKQLLWCTQIPISFYKASALVGLLARPCASCKKEGRLHDISLLGSLAHRYRLCIPFDQCLFDHLALANRRRNIEAAHSSAQKMWHKPPVPSRELFATESRQAAEEFVHMLQHIGELEERIYQELVMIAVQVRSSAEAPLKPTSASR